MQIKLGSLPIENSSKQEYFIYLNTHVPKSVILTHDKFSYNYESVCKYNAGINQGFQDFQNVDKKSNTR